jgi:hypothetical protein
MTISSNELQDQCRLQYNLARTMAAMSLAFIIVVTPWTLKEVVFLGTGAKVPTRCN